MGALDLSEFITEEDRRQFHLDARENLDSLEESLLELEKTPDDQESVARVFRAMHTIKGTAGMYGFEEAAHFTHQIENHYDRIRNGEVTLTKEVVDLTLAATDQLNRMLSENGREADREELERITAAFHILAKETIDPIDPTVQEESAPKDGFTLFHIRFRFTDDPVLARATNPMVYLKCLSELGEAAITCFTEAVPDLADLDPGRCYLYWDVSLFTNQSADDIRGEFLFVEDDLAELTIVARLDHEETELDIPPPRLGEILTARGDVASDQVAQVLEKQKPIGQMLVEAGVTTPQKIKSALNEQKMTEKCAVAKPEAAISSLRVSSDKLDHLINQVGELVIAQARLHELAGAYEEDLNLAAVSEEIARLTESLRDSTMDIRMLPIGTIFSRFNRLVRDLSRELGKEVELVTLGGETELDKTVIEHLNDPLVHIIRNSIDHGIESPAERLQAGKAASGRVQLSAIHSGASVLIRITDDGKGLDANRIRKKAAERGIIAEGSDLTDREAYNLIFAPGFSTAETITNVSGRGVGMDVVKRSIDLLRGSVEVNSTPGKGTTLTIKLPLTLAIIDGFLVQCGDEIFVLPLAMVKECVKLTPVDIKRAHGRQIINIRDEIVPYVRLRDLFNSPGQADGKEQVVVTEVDRHRVGMVVDRVIGQSQVVIKSLGDIFLNVAEFSGATILGDGRVVPILDVARIIETAKGL